MCWCYKEVQSTTLSVNALFKWVEFVDVLAWKVIIQQNGIHCILDTNPKLYFGWEAYILTLKLALIALAGNVLLGGPMASLTLEARTVRRTSTFIFQCHFPHQNICRPSRTQQNTDGVAYCLC